MNGKNSPLITNEPVEFEEQLIEVWNFRKNINYLEGLMEYTSNK